jgi:hypothetical protein
MCAFFPIVIGSTLSGNHLRSFPFGVKLLHQNAQGASVCFTASPGDAEKVSLFGSRKEDYSTPRQPICPERFNSSKMRHPYA